MNGIEALYKCMKDPELELLNGDDWFTFDEYFDSESDSNPGPSMTGILNNDWQVRKRQSPIDACLEELDRSGAITKIHVKEILLKHWPKEMEEKKYFREHYCSSCKHIQEVEMKSDYETVLNYPVCSECSSCAWFPLGDKEKDVQDN